MNLKGKMRKLQTAILQTGLVIKLNTHQFYSAEQKRMITLYKICTPVWYFSERNTEWKVMDYEILKTCSVEEVIYCLLDIHEAVKDWKS